MNKLRCNAKGTQMSKKHNPTGQPRLVKVADKAGDELQFPADRHVMTPNQREVPSPAAAIAEATTLRQISERQRLRANAVSQEQRDARARREALAILEREDARRDAIAHGPAPMVREDLQAVRRRPLDAPMATRIGSMPDPLAVLAWDAIIEDAAATARSWWERVRLPLAFTTWSIGCFMLGVISCG